MISQLVSSDMMRRELRDLSEANGGNVIRLASEAQAGFSIRNTAGKPVLIAVTDSQRKRIIDVAVPGDGAVPADVFIELADHVIGAGLGIDGAEGRCGVLRDASGRLHSFFDLPDELELAAPVSFHGAYDIRLPRILRTSSDFVLIGANITTQPEVMEVAGDADFSDCRMGCLPEGAAFGGSLVLSRSTTPSLPRRISVRRWLRMQSTSIEVIPSSARIGGLDAQDSALRVVPPGLRIEGDLIVSGSAVRRLSGVSIGGSLYVERLQSVEISDDCDIGANVYADHDTQTVMPARLDARLFLRNPFGYERPPVQSQ